MPYLAFGYKNPVGSTLKMAIWDAASGKRGLQSISRVGGEIWQHTQGQWKKLSFLTCAHQSFFITSKSQITPPFYAMQCQLFVRCHSNVGRDLKSLKTSFSHHSFIVPEAGKKALVKFLIPSHLMEKINFARLRFDAFYFSFHTGSALLDTMLVSSGCKHKMTLNPCPCLPV